MESKFKMGWPKELWLHEQSLSPSPQNIMYGDDEQYVAQQQKIKLIKEQEKKRKERQYALIQKRRNARLERKNRAVLPDEEANRIIANGDFLENFRKKAKWMERTLGINSVHLFNDYNVKGAQFENISADDMEDNKYNEPSEDATKTK